MKPKYLILVVGTIMYFITCLFSWYKIQEKNTKINSQELEIVKLWDDKIADFQLHINITYRNENIYTHFFDSLNTCFNILRTTLHEPNFSLEDQSYLSDFLLKRMPKVGFIKEEEILEQLGVAAIPQVFEHKNIQAIEKLAKVLNPDFMTKCKFFQDFDIWEKKDFLDFKEGDTTVFMVRLILNYALNSHQLEFIEDENVKVIEPYLAEIRYIAPPKSKEQESTPFSFRLFNWVERDTVTETINFN